MRAVVAFLILTSVGWASLQAQRLPVLAQAESLALLRANVVNVRDGSVLPNATVVIQSGRIESIGAGSPPANVKSIDLGGAFVVPGLIDGHSHIAGLTGAKRALELGVTTARSSGMNGASAADVGLRELAKKTAIAAPDVLAAGYILRPSLAPDVFLLNPAFWELERGLNSVDRVRQAVKMNLGHGVDWIKMLVTEGIGGDPTKLQFTETEVVAAVEEARRSEIPVQAHAFSDEGVRIALKLESALSNTAALYQKKPWT